MAAMWVYSRRRPVTAGNVNDDLDVPLLPTVVEAPRLVVAA
jgi:hypothetical protein